LNTVSKFNENLIQKQAAEQKMKLEEEQKEIEKKEKEREQLEKTNKQNSELLKKEPSNITFENKSTSIDLDKDHDNQGRLKEKHVTYVKSLSDLKNSLKNDEFLLKQDSYNSNTPDSSNSDSTNSLNTSPVEIRKNNPVSIEHSPEKMLMLQTFNNNESSMFARALYPKFNMNSTLDNTLHMDKGLVGSIQDSLNHNVDGLHTMLAGFNQVLGGLGQPQQ